MFEVSVTIDPRVVHTFFTEKKECYFPMNFDVFLGEHCAAEGELIDQTLVVDPHFVHTTRKSHIAPAIWLLRNDVRLSHIQRAVILTEDGTIVCFIREARPGRCYSHEVKLQRLYSPKNEHIVYFGPWHWDSIGW